LVAGIKGFGKIDLASLGKIRTKIVVRPRYDVQMAVSVDVSDRDTPRVVELIEALRSEVTRDLFWLDLTKPQILIRHILELHFALAPYIQADRSIFGRIVRGAGPYLPGSIVQK
jgi:hypothetical protein